MGGRGVGRGISFLRFSRRGSCQKKAAGHVEMIVAFTLFFFFVLFLLSVLKPYDVNTMSGSVVAGIYDNFEKNTTTNFTKAFISVNLSEVPSSEKCFYVELPGGLFAYGFTNSVVYNLSEVIKRSNLSDSGKLGIYEDFSAVGADVMGYYDVLISPEFNESTMGGCHEIKNYSLGGIVDNQVISRQYLIDMSKRYTSDYAGLGAELGVPPTYDFSIIVEGLPNDYSYTMQGVAPPESGDVVVRNYIKEVLYPNGSIYNAKIGIKVW